MKYYPHGSVLLVTFRVEEGLLLVDNPLIRGMLQSCFARAQYMHPVRICHFLVEATHMHMVVVVENPTDMKDFIKHLKCDTAHMINRILGREKRTVWCAGFDSPVILTLARAIVAIAYLYSNPTKDNLVNTIDEYPGFTSWDMYRKGELTKRWRYLHRPQFRKLAPHEHSPNGYRKEAERMQEDGEEYHKFHLEPDAWLAAFNVTDPEERKRYNQRIVTRVQVLEERAANKRKLKGHNVIGRERLMRRPMELNYRPKRDGGCRTNCVSDRRAVRMKFMEFLDELIADAKRIQNNWRLGDYSERYPLGLFPPSMPKLAEPLTIMVR